MDILISRIIKEPSLALEIQSLSLSICDLQELFENQNRTKMTLDLFGEWNKVGKQTSKPVTIESFMF